MDRDRELRLSLKLVYTDRSHGEPEGGEACTVYQTSSADPNKASVTGLPGLAVQED